MRWMTPICLVCLLAAPALGQERQLILSGSNLWALDPDTAETTVLAAPTPDTYAVIGAASGPLYGAGTISTELGAIDLDTGAFQSTVPFPVLGVIGDLHFTSETEALVFGRDDLKQVDVNTGSVLSVGLTGVTEFMLGIVGRSDGQIVVTGDGDDGGVMYSVDPTTWVATPISMNLGVDFPVSMETVGDTTYLLGGSLGRDLYTVDLFTGATSLIATLDITPATSLSSVVVPSPATVPVMLAGAAFAARRRRPRR